jgi:thiol-disulfide isomerase/thioredoxin
MIGPVYAAQTGSQPLTPFEDNGQDFSLTDNKGQQRSLDDFKGNVVLVNFWASWCPPCIYEMPELQRLQEHFTEQPFTVITINVGEKKYRVRKFTRLINFDLPVMLDTTKATFDSWGIQTLPTSFLIDKKGDIRYRVRGNPGWQEKQTLEIIESLITENSDS